SLAVTPALLAVTQLPATVTVLAGMAAAAAGCCQILSCMRIGIDNSISHIREHGLKASIVHLFSKGKNEDQDAELPQYQRISNKSLRALDAKKSINPNIGRPQKRTVKVEDAKSVEPEAKPLLA